MLDIKKIVSDPSIFHVHLNFLCLGLKSVQSFHFVSNLN
jgi:hypothetical protein